MEAVAAASSIAGIVGLAGQALSGIVKLRGFFQDYASASKTIQRFLRDLNSLIQTLEDVKDIVLKLEETVAVTFDTQTTLSSLQIQVEDCAGDVYAWVKIAESQHPEFGSGKGGLHGCKTRFKKFLVAVNKESLTDIFREISSHKENITLKLSVIGRSFDIEQAACLKSITSKLDDFAVATNTSNQITSDALRTLEAQLSPSRDDQLGSPDLRSLASSMVSSISRIENLLLAQSSRPGSRASSAGLSSAGSGMPPGRRSSAASGDRISPAPSESRAAKQHSFLFSPVKRRHSRAGFQSTSPVQRHPQESDREYSRRTGLTVLSSSVGELHASRHFHEPEEVETYALFTSYSKLLDRANEMLPDCMVRYINLNNYARTISLHSKLIVSTLGVTRGLQWDHEGEVSEPKHEKDQEVLASEQNSEARREYQHVCHELEILKQDLVLLRKECWEKGHDLSEIDTIFGAQSSAEKALRENLKSAIIDDNFKALRRRLEHLQSQTAWTSRLDRINSWLLQNLAASSEAAALHRTFLPHGGESLDENEWARQVLKYWPLDGAAAKLKRLEGKEMLNSSIGGIKDGRVAHSVRVLLDMVDWANSLTSGSEVGEGGGNALRGLFEVERPKSPLKEAVL